MEPPVYKQLGDSDIACVSLKELHSKRIGTIAYIVRCPQCHEVNSGSLLHCAKCQTSLIGISREQVPSTIPETNVDQKPKENAFKKLDRTKAAAAGGLSSIYLLTAFLSLIKSLLEQVWSSQFLGFTLVLLIIGLVLYLTPVDILWRMERDSGFFRPRLGPFENSGFNRAAGSYPVLGILFMLIAIGINIIFLFVQ